MRVLRELRKVYGVAHPTRKTLQDSNYELPASRGLTRKRPWKLTPARVQVGAANSAGINTHALLGGFLNFWLSHVI